MNFLFDSNIVIYYLAGLDLPDFALERLDEICQSGHQVSVISKLELLGYNFTSADDEDNTTEFINKSITYPFDKGIENETIRIRKNTKVKLADAIIAATAIVNDLTLLTRNVGDFKNVPGLKIENPFDWEK